jgi:hypothetical protein
MTDRGFNRRVFLGSGAAAAGLTFINPGIASAQTTPEANATPVAEMYDPYARLPQAPSFDLTSTDVKAGELMAKPQMVQSPSP